jgi:hypothetical protein
MQRDICIVSTKEDLMKIVFFLMQSDRNNWSLFDLKMSSHFVVILTHRNCP